MFTYSLAHWASFFTAAILLNLSPGPDMAFILGQTAKRGVKSGFSAALTFCLSCEHNAHNLIYDTRNGLIQISGLVVFARTCGSSMKKPKFIRNYQIKMNYE